MHFPKNFFFSKVLLGLKYCFEVQKTKKVINKNIKSCFLCVDIISPTNKLVKKDSLRFVQTNKLQMPTDWGVIKKS